LTHGICTRANLARVTGTARANFDSNLYDVDTGEEIWMSGPNLDRTEGQYASKRPHVDEDVRDEYAAFLAGSPLPSRAG
jgi:hypothetical protein